MVRAISACQDLIYNLGIGIKNMNRFRLFMILQTGRAAYMARSALFLGALQSEYKGVVSWVFVT